MDRWEPARPRVATKPRPATSTATRPEPSPAGLDPTIAVQVLDNPPQEERFVSCVPFYDLAAAAGAFGREQPAADPHAHRGWVRGGGRKLTKDMFALRIEDHSMEPRIADGSICLNRSGEALAGSRENRIVLVVLRDGVDPETGGRLTNQRYHSEKSYDDSGGFAHTRIELQPLNRDFPPIVFIGAEEGSLSVLGEFVEVIACAAR